MGKSHDLATIADDGLDVTSLSVGSGGLTVGTDQLVVDSSGRVIMAGQPSFYATRSSSSSTLGAGTYYDVIFDVAHHNIGSNYNTSTGVFTAPVAGLYQFNMIVRFDNVGGTYHLIRPYINGVSVNGIYSIQQESGSYDTAAISFAYLLSANDTVKTVIREHSDTSWIYSSQSSFSGYLVG